MSRRPHFSMLGDGEEVGEIPTGILCLIRAVAMIGGKRA